MSQETHQEKYQELTPESEPLVEVKGLTIEFDTPQGRKRVVDQVNFAVAPGEVLGVLGESGSGKTMSTLAILGLVNGYPGVMGGEITLRDHAGDHHLLEDLGRFIYHNQKRDLPEKRARAWQKRRGRQMRSLWGSSVTAIFQNPRRSLDPLMTIGAQVLESIQARRNSSRPQNQDHQSPSRSELSEQDPKSEALSWLERVRMVNPSRVFYSYPHELSGGMCQRAMIAVALACKPRLLIADEPTTGLDATVRAQVVHLLQELIEEERCAMIYITHDIREMLYLADRVIVMRHGVVLESVSKHDLQTRSHERAEYTQILLSAAGIDASTHQD